VRWGASVNAELAAAEDVLKEALRDRARLHSVIPPAGGPGRRHRQRAGAARWPRWLPRWLPRCSPSVGGRIGMPGGTYGVDGSWTRRTRTGPLLQPWPCGRYWRPNGSGHSRFVRHFTTTSTRSSRLRRRPTPMTSTTRRVPLWRLNGHRSLRCWLSPDHDWTTSTGPSSGASGAATGSARAVARRSLRSDSPRVQRHGPAFAALFEPPTVAPRRRPRT